MTFTPSSFILHCQPTMTHSVMNCLPVPEIRDENLRHSKKQLHKGNVKKPPKINKYSTVASSNRSINSSSAHVVSFRDSSSASSDEQLSSCYNKDKPISYFDQCFDTVSRIGEGSFGEVFKVRSIEDGLLYAVKKSKQFFRSEKNRQERLEEVKRYEQFSNHEHCVTLYKAWEQDDRLFMQMELCQGSLENYLLKKGQLTEDEIWSILLDMLLALKSLHDRNLIHLDIKLENILVGNDGTCKLGDFGLVVDVDRANLFQTTEGDSRYIAPELLSGKFSKAVDVFSLGITILELSCNLELPPNGPLWQQLRSGILPEEFIKQISPELQEIIKSMMAPDALRRPTVDQLLIHRKLVEILQCRRRWKYLNKAKKYYRKTRRLLWAKMCNLKNIILSLIYQFLILLKLKEPINQRDNDSFTENFLNGSGIQNSPVHNFSRNSCHIINSTPLNSHLSSTPLSSDDITSTPYISHSYRRIKKDLSKISLRLTDDGVNDFSPQQSPYNSMKIRNENHDNHEISSLICKKLFSQADDTD